MTPPTPPEADAAPELDVLAITVLADSWLRWDVSDSTEREKKGALAVAERMLSLSQLLLPPPPRPEFEDVDDLGWGRLEGPLRSRLPASLPLSAPLPLFARNAAIEGRR